MRTSGYGWVCDSRLSSITLIYYGKIDRYDMHHKYTSIALLLNCFSIEKIRECCMPAEASVFPKSANEDGLEIQ